jgi:hypothetical protein
MVTSSSRDSVSPDWYSRDRDFKEISRCRDKEATEASRSGYLSMISRGFERGYKIPGEAEYEARCSKFLKDKMERTGASVVPMRICQSIQTRSR